MTPRAILVASDFTLAADNAAWRAAQLAREHGATLRLLQVAPDARLAQVAQSGVERLAESILQRLGVVAELVVGGSDLQRETARAAAAADLLVVPARDGAGWRERIAGTRTERLVRASRIPVLVVKRTLPRVRAPEPQGPGEALYARVLACVGDSPASTHVIAAAAGLGANARMEVFHALSLARGRAGRPGGEAGQTPIVERTRLALQAHIAQAGAQQIAVAGVGFGPAGACVLARERAMGADLVVLGKREGRLLGGFFLGALAREVLAGARCDVLVVPTMPLRALPESAVSATGGLY